MTVAPLNRAPTPAAAALMLRPHPATPCTALRRVQVRIDAPRADAWRLRYELVGELAALRLPPPAAAPAARDGLWRHTCVEAFIGTADAAAYREFNFSPAGDWAAYAFSAERVRAALAQPPAVRVLRRQGRRTLRLDAWLPRAALPPAPGGYRLGLSAVIEAADGSLSYWALRHPRAQPDFHQRAGWTARLPALAPRP